MSKELVAVPNKEEGDYDDLKGGKEEACPVDSQRWNKEDAGGKGAQASADQISGIEGTRRFPR